jgi:hypothetical protein
MPTVPPSQVVALIDLAFPWAASEASAGNDLVASHAPSVGGIIALVDQLTPGVLSSLSPEEYAAFLGAIAAMRTSLGMWETPSHTGYAHRLRPMAEFGNRSPVQAVRHALSKCPDETAAHASTELAFLADPEFEATLLLDISTASSALNNGEFKAASVIAGSVIEALLLWALRRRSAHDHAAAFAKWRAVNASARPLPRDIRQWSAEQYIEIARHVPVISEGSASAAALAKNYRNLIHPGRAERLQERPTLGSALLSVGAMRHLTDDINARVSSGAL